jgi:hypothetical protein
MKALNLNANTLSWPHDDEPETRIAKCRACPESADPCPSVAGRSSVLSVAFPRGLGAAVGAHVFYRTNPEFDTDPEASQHVRSKTARGPCGVS